jgi:hypothetical protein
MGLALFLFISLFFSSCSGDNDFKSSKNSQAVRTLTYNPVPPPNDLEPGDLLKNETDIPIANLGARGYFKTGLCGQFRYRSEENNSLTSTNNTKSSKNSNNSKNKDKNLHKNKNTKSIYGIDNRMDFCPFLGDKDAVTIAQATAMSLYSHQLLKVDTVQGEDIFSIYGITVGELMLRQNKQICSDVIDFNLMSYSFCTAVLVAPQTIMTPKHCVNPSASTGANAAAAPTELDQHYLASIRYAFTINPDLTRYQNQDLNRKEFVLEKSQIFSIDSVLYLSAHNDFALVKLKEPTDKIQPLQLHPKDPNFIAKIHAQDLMLFGHPLGEKLTLNFGKAISANDNFIYSTLDSFQGNSGSPIFARKLFGKEVIGILVKGMDDWTYNLEDDCLQEAVYPEELNSPRYYETILSAQTIQTEFNWK